MRQALKAIASKVVIVMMRYKFRNETAWRTLPSHGTWESAQVVLARIHAACNLDASVHVVLAEPVQRIHKDACVTVARQMRHQPQPLRTARRDPPESLPTRTPKVERPPTPVGLSCMYCRDDGECPFM